MVEAEAGGVLKNLFWIFDGGGEGNVEGEAVGAKDGDADAADGDGKGGCIENGSGFEDHFGFFIAGMEVEGKGCGIGEVLGESFVAGAADGLVGGANDLCDGGVEMEGIEGHEHDGCCAIGRGDQGRGGDEMAVDFRDDEGSYVSVRAAGVDDVTGGCECAGDVPFGSGAVGCEESKVELRPVGTIDCLASDRGVGLIE